MRRLVIVLGITSVAFAGSTAYLARELSIERERSALVRTSAPAAPTDRPHVAAVTAKAAVAPAPPTADKPGSRDINVGFISEPGAQALPMSEYDIKKAQAEYSRTILAQLADPERREEILAEHKMMMRMSYPRVDQVLGLSAAEHSRLLELFAQQQMDMQEASARCMSDPSCQLRDLHLRDTDTRKRDIDELLGTERAAKFEAYKNTIGEREIVSRLRDRLPDVQRLSDANAELLISALAEERDLLHREASQRGAGMNQFSVGAGLIFAPAEGGSFEQRYESARQSSQRMRDRAAQFLSAEQMRAFDEMQDETLIALRSALRNKDVGRFGTVSVATPAN